MIHIILLSGGSGSRLWPLSNSARSKQFLKVLRDCEGRHISMVQRVFGQIRNVEANLDITIATSAAQENSIKMQVDGVYNLVLEPERRDTAPAIMLACAYLDSVKRAKLEDTIIVMPIDTFADQDYYDCIVEIDDAVQNDISDVVLLGVKPDCPSEKYGYIVPADKGEYPRRVLRFTEKPTELQAEELISQSALWNCGVFGFKLGYVRKLSAQYLQGTGYESMLGNYSALPKNSFDYEVVEKASSISVVGYDGTWKDLGTWNSLSEEMPECMLGRAIASNVRNVHIVNETGLPMVVAGLEDAVVVATHDGILVCSKDASSNIKELIEQISESRPMYEKRRWGEYRVIDSRVYGDNCCALTKELVIAAGKQLSYQRHMHRSEIWTVVDGEGEIVLDGCVVHATADTVMHVHPMQMHAIRAFRDLHIIEVQFGFPLIEEDIERFGNYWE